MATLVGLTDAKVHDGGEAISFVIETEDAPPFELKLRAPEAADVVQFICALASAAAGVRATENPLADPRYYFAPIPAAGIGFQAGPTPDKTWLVMNVNGFGVAFEIESSGLADMADKLGQIARTLSAGGPHQ